MIIRADPMTKTGLFMVGRTTPDGQTIKLRIEVEFESPDEAKEFVKTMYANHNDPLLTCRLILLQADERAVHNQQNVVRDRIAREGQDIVTRSMSERGW